MKWSCNVPIDRRTFLLAAGLSATAPALACLLSLPAIAQLPAAQPPDVLPPAIGTVPNGDTDGVTFGIDGWALCDNAPAAGLVLISVNRSWRSAWR
jgi:hypothetical protein